MEPEGANGTDEVPRSIKDEFKPPFDYPVMPILVTVKYDPSRVKAGSLTQECLRCLIENYGSKVSSISCDNITGMLARCVS